MEEIQNYWQSDLLCASLHLINRVFQPPQKNITLHNTHVQKHTHSLEPAHFKAHLKFSRNYLIDSEEDRESHVVRTNQNGAFNFF